MKRAHLHLSAFVAVPDEAGAGHLAKRLREAAEAITAGYYCDTLTVGTDCEEESAFRRCEREAWLREQEAEARRG